MMNNRDNDPGTLENLGLSNNGPTLREYVDKGHDPAGYPPAGFAAIVDDDYREEIARRREDARQADETKRLQEDQARLESVLKLSEKDTAPADPPASTEPVTHTLGQVAGQ